MGAKTSNELRATSCELLAVDLGNSAIKLGLFKGARLVRRTEFPLGAKKKMAGCLAVFVKAGRPRGAIFCSVVPGLTPWLAKELKGLSGTTALRVTRRLDLGLKVRVKSGVGADRLVNAVAACHLYRLPCVVIDLGTATTYDVVSARKEYLGGVIAPGIKGSAEVLGKRGAQLPLIDVRRNIKCPGRVIGKDTAAAMRSGLVFGQIGQLAGILRQIKRELGREPVVIATGGFAGLMARMGAPFEHVDKDLTLKGLRIIYEMNVNSEL